MHPGIFPHKSHVDKYRIVAPGMIKTILDNQENPSPTCCTCHLTALPSVNWALHFQLNSWVWTQQTTKWPYLGKDQHHRVQTHGSQDHMHPSRRADLGVIKPQCGWQLSKGGNYTSLEWDTPQQTAGWRKTSHSTAIISDLEPGLHISRTNNPISVYTLPWMGS